MEKLNELVDLAEKADAVANLIDGVNPHTILAIAEAFGALEQAKVSAEHERDCHMDISDYFKESWLTQKQRTEAAEAKLAELAQQKPIGWLNDAYLGRGVIDGEVGEDDFGPGYIPIYSHPFNDVPAPAADLPDLSPINNCLAFFASAIKSGESWSSTCQRDYDAALSILRNIEEAK